MQLTVLNPGGKDPAQSFPDMAGPVDPSVHGPINYHAYAACTRGSFQKSAEHIDGGPILLLLRRNLKQALKALCELKDKGCTVAVSWKESGLHQVGAQLEKADSVTLFNQICRTADGALSSTPNLVPLYRAAGARHAAFIPTPYPLEDPRWDFSLPAQQRAGIFVGTREFTVPSRNHWAAVLMACELGVPVTVINLEGRAARRKLEALGCARIIEKRLPYADYLRLLAQHQLVLQLDRSSVPGQVAGDALLCGIPCIGGDGATDHLAFPETRGLDFEEIRALAQKLLSDTGFAASFTDNALTTAREWLGFGAVVSQLEVFYRRIAG